MSSGSTLSADCLNPSRLKFGKAYELKVLSNRYQAGPAVVILHNCHKRNLARQCMRDKAAELHSVGQCWCSRAVVLESGFYGQVYIIIPTEDWSFTSVPGGSVTRSFFLN